MSAIEVLLDVKPDVTAVCTAKPVRFTCSWNSVSKPARRVAAAVADSSVADELLEELLELVLGAIDIDELDEDPAGCDEREDELPLEVHAVEASASATTALAMLTVDLRTDIRTPA